MFFIVNFVCFISIGFLVAEIFIFFCKDSIKVYNESIKLSKKKVEKIIAYTYTNKIAK